MALFRISNSSHDAATRTVQAAEHAEDLGYSNVQRHYHPGTNGQPGTHTVTGEPPAAPESPRGLFRR
jgi:hypothetical protein